MKRVLLLTAFIAVLLLPIVALTTTTYAAVNLFESCKIVPAVEPKPGEPKITNVCKDVKTQGTAGKNPVIVLLKTVLEILAFIAGVAAILLIIINGLRLILSNGDSSSINGARTGLVYALIGVAIVVIAQTIVVFVLDKVQ